MEALVSHRRFTLWPVLVVLLLAIAAAPGCATKRRTGAVVGTSAGVAVGAAFGAQAAVIGGLAGLIIGSEIGRHMDKHDRHEAQHVLEHNRSGQRHDWVNPDSGRQYSMTPDAAYNGPNGEPCRRFLLREGRRGEVTEQTACRRPDGIWEIAS